MMLTHPVIPEIQNRLYPILQLFKPHQIRPNGSIHDGFIMMWAYMASTYIVVADLSRVNFVGMDVGVGTMQTSGSGASNVAVAMAW
uniref:Uncharacterized protein n=1 Tax=Arundo donax TaxID=35708 RepID=A0A0A9BUY2_ARUDO